MRVLVVALALVEPRGAVEGVEVVLVARGRREEARDEVVEVEVEHVALARHAERELTRAAVRRPVLGRAQERVEARAVSRAR